jgi:hypothetical protein
MSLGDKLRARRERFRANEKPEVLEVMDRAAAELRRSQIAERALGVGARAPEFTLPDARGEMRSSRRLLERGPLVVTVYRGVW